MGCGFWGSLFGVQREMEEVPAVFAADGLVCAGGKQDLGIVRVRCLEGEGKGCIFIQRLDLEALRYILDKIRDKALGLFGVRCEDSTM